MRKQKMDVRSIRLNIDTGSPVPLYYQLKEQIRSEILDSKIPPGTRLFSERDIMKEYNLSYPTVTRALRDLVHDGLLDRVRGKGTFVAERVDSRKIIGMVYSSDITNGHYLSKILETVTVYCSARGYELKVYNNICGDTAGILRDTAANHLVSGFLLASPFDPDFVSLLEGKVPFVWINNRMSERDENCVVCDTNAAIDKAVEYLADLGHRDIGVIAGPTYTWCSEEMIKRFRSNLKRRGLTWHSDWLSSGEWGEETGYSLMGRLLSLESKPTAVIVEEDRLAIGAIKALSEKGLSVPEDVSMIAIGHIVPVDLQPLPLTVVDMHLEEVGRRSIDMLDSIIRHSGKPQLVKVAPDIIAGATAGRRDVQYALSK
ncbi:MAG: GntR family transcriptional regulator [bacterium]|nr:GntR family transcriptional regulator [bacterium]